MKRGLGWVTGIGAVILLASAGVAKAADDDLAVVRRAVADARPADVPTRRAVTSSANRAEPAEPQWLRVRIQEKREKKARVSVNLPLSLVRAVGSDWPLDGRCHRRKHEGPPCMTIGEALRSLESGQDIVQIDDEESTVRVWVE
jgi:hypothetical protein